MDKTVAFSYKSFTCKFNTAFLPRTCPKSVFIESSTKFFFVSFPAFQQGSLYIFHASYALSHQPTSLMDPSLQSHTPLTIDYSWLILTIPGLLASQKGQIKPSVFSIKVGLVNFLPHPFVMQFISTSFVLFSAWPLLGSKRKLFSYWSWNTISNNQCSLQLA